MYPTLEHELRRSDWSHSPVIHFQIEIRRQTLLPLLALSLCTLRISVLLNLLWNPCSTSFGLVSSSSSASNTSTSKTSSSDQAFSLRLSLTALPPDLVSADMTRAESDSSVIVGP